MSFTSSSTAPQTLLEAVNELLDAVRMSSVMSLLAADLNEDAAQALRAINDASISLQTKGWNFNTELAVLDPTTDGEVSLPQNTLKVRKARCSAGFNVVQRGQKLYLTGERSYNIGRAVTADLVVGLEFEELPSTARAYVVAYAARKFCIPRNPSTTTFRYTEEYLREAWIDMEQEDSESRDTTLPMTSPHFAQMRKR